MTSKDLPWPYRNVSNLISCVLFQMSIDLPVQSKGVSAAGDLQQHLQMKEGGGVGTAMNTLADEGQDDDDEEEGTTTGASGGGREQEIRSAQLAQINMMLSKKI